MLASEARLIQDELQRSRHRERFALEPRRVMEPLDVLRELRRLRPTVIHVSDPGRQKALVSTAALSKTLEAVGASVNLVVLSACYSRAEADALLAHSDCVVWTGAATSPEIARTFAIGFYGALGDGESIAAAYKQGCAAISLEGLSVRDPPEIKARDGVDAARLVLSAHPTQSPRSAIGGNGGGAALDRHSDGCARCRVAGDGTPTGGS